MSTNVNSSFAFDLSLRKVVNINVRTYLLQQCLINVHVSF